MNPIFVKSKFTSHNLNAEAHYVETVENSCDVSCAFETTEYLFLAYARDHIAKKIENNSENLSLGAAESVNRAFKALFPNRINAQTGQVEPLKMNILIKSIWEKTRTFAVKLIENAEDKTDIEIALQEEKQAQDFAYQKTLLYHQQGRKSCYVFTNLQAKLLLHTVNSLSSIKLS